MAENKKQLEDKKVEAISGGFGGDLFEGYSKKYLKNAGIKAERHTFGHNIYTTREGTTLKGRAKLKKYLDGRKGQTFELQK